MKLAVGGCSFSDYRYGITPYGKRLSEELDCEYIHAAACAGSNHRIWRVLTRHIIDKDLTAGDIILLQYRIIDRKEIWSPEPNPYDSPVESLDEPWEDGKIFRLSVHSEEYSVCNIEKQYSKYHNRCNNIEFNKEMFWTNHAMFDALCKQNNITLININTQYDRDNRVPGIVLDDILEEKELRLDTAHMNQKGHIVSALRILPELKTLSKFQRQS